MAASPTANANEGEGISATKEGTVESPPLAQPPYSAFSPARKKFILSIVIAKAFIAPVSAGIYMPLLPTLAEDLNVSPTLINLTVTVFMLTFAVAVCVLPTSPFFYSTSLSFFPHFQGYEQLPR